MAKKKKELDILEEAASKLSPKQLEFCQLYLDDPRRDGAKAYMKVFKSCKNLTSARTLSWRLLKQGTPTRDYVDLVLTEARKHGFMRLRVNEENVLNELSKMAFSNIKDYYDEDGQLIPLHKLSDDAAAAIVKIRERVVRVDGESGEELIHREVELADKKGSLQLLGQNLALFTQKIENEVSGSLSVDFLEQLGEEMLDDLISPLPKDNL